MMSSFQSRFFITKSVPHKNSLIPRNQNVCTKNTTCSFMQRKNINIFCCQNVEIMSSSVGGFGGISSNNSTKAERSQEVVALKSTVVDGRATTAAAVVEPLVESNSGVGIGVVKFLQGKCYFVTGATGYVAKVFIEKLLRTVPDVDKIFLLIKAKNKEAAMDRLNNEIINSEPFKCLKQMHGKSYEVFMQCKLIPIVGTLGESNLGMDIDCASEIAKEVDVIVNSAANTTLDERYDVALDINTRGPGWLMNFAKKCRKLKLFLHVSTAFANGEREGIIFEKPFCTGESITKKKVTSENPSVPFPLVDVEAEIKLAFNSRHAFQGNAVTQKMKELGLERARLYGWQNTYLFTKAMGEMLISSMRGDIPVVIIRPTIIESAYKEPFPGWIQGNRVLDPLIISYGKGQLPGYLADPQVHMDVVPVDMVVNATMVAIAKHGMAGIAEVSVYHVASAVVNPLFLRDLFEFSREHFLSSPFMDSVGKNVGINGMKYFSSMEDFSKYVWAEIAEKNGLVLDGSDLINRGLEKKCKKKLEHAVHIAKIYEPYMFYKAWFHNGNTQKLMEDMSEEEKENFGTDANTIDWRDYLLNIHIPGVRKYVMKGR